MMRSESPRSESLQVPYLPELCPSSPKNKEILSKGQLTLAPISNFVSGLQTSTKFDAIKRRKLQAPLLRADSVMFIPIDGDIITEKSHESSGPVALLRPTGTKIIKQESVSKFNSSTFQTTIANVHNSEWKTPKIQSPVCWETHIRIPSRRTYSARREISETPRDTMSYKDMILFGETPYLPEL